MESALNHSTRINRGASGEERTSEGAVTSIMTDSFESLY